MDYSSALAVARSLSVEDRLRLVETIWDEIAAQPICCQLTEAQERELQRRLAEDDEQPDDVVPWDVVKKEALERGRR